MLTAWKAELYLCKIAGTKDFGRDLLITGTPHYHTVQYTDGDEVMPHYQATKNEKKNVKEAKSFSKQDVKRLIEYGGIWLA